MSDNMASWRSLANAASRSIKGYVSQRELKRTFPATRDVQAGGGEGNTRRQTWGQWAGQKLRRGSRDDYDTSADKLSLFPGWATRRYHESIKSDAEDASFDVDVFVSGYACRLSGIGFTTRSGKAFLRLAKGFAALPKLPGGAGSGRDRVPPLSRSTEDLLASAHLPPLPNEITEESEVEALESRLRSLDAEASSTKSGQSRDTSSGASSQRSRSPSVYYSAAMNNGPNTNGSESSFSSDLHRWHANLEERLHPFWSSALSGRTIRVSLYASDPTLYDSDGEYTNESGSSDGPPEKQPILSRNVGTTADGSFSVKFSVSWESMCLHPGALHVAFGDPSIEYDLFVVAELLPPSPAPSPPSSQPHTRHPSPLSTPVPTVSSSISIPLTYSTVRLISDIDDTVKLSNILSGARAVFRNVFVNDLRDSVIPGMGEWYTDMWRSGIRFHYVSNGPFELLPVVNQFFQVSQLPPGSVRLRSYGGRSLFNGLLSAPAMRKRAGVLDVLNHFPDAKFVLVGDSGEQDLELYAGFAKERPEQILAVFVRDASAHNRLGALDDPTGFQALRTSSNPGLGLRVPSLSNLSRRSTLGRSPPLRSISMSEALSMSKAKPTRTYSGTNLHSPSVDSSNGYFTSLVPTSPSISEEPQGIPGMLARPGLSKEPESYLPPPIKTQQSWSEPEKRRNDLQMRVWRARQEIPEHIPLRVFREPKECVEVNIILERLQVRGRRDTLRG